MKASVTIPERTTDQSVLFFKITTGSLLLRLVLHDPIKGQVMKEVDMTPEWESATATQRNIIKAFFKTAGMKGINALNEEAGVIIEVADIDEDLFE